MIDAVVKVGGSLGRGPRIPALASELARLGTERGLLVVPGGGAFADVARDYDARLGLRPAAAHWAAVLGMDAFATVLADVIPGARAVRTFDAADAAARSGAVAVLLAHDLLREADPLPHAWSVTSDSIAAWVAVKVRAPLLVLLKDGRGMRVPLAGSREAPSGELGVAALSRWACVDETLGSVVRDEPPAVWVVDGEQPERLRELLLTGETEGVSLVR